MWTNQDAIQSINLQQLIQCTHAIDAFDIDDENRFAVCVVQVGFQLRLLLLTTQPALEFSSLNGPMLDCADKVLNLL